ncbi:MAG: nucleotidyltransferase domain-containing protein, partial [Candidatus Omnitrophica bacterium]|nr:nucleotidyltransferase domain-containing protein [Candidatus Omnitrophota bacterium]
MLFNKYDGGDRQSKMFDLIRGKLELSLRNGNYEEALKIFEEALVSYVDDTNKQKLLSVTVSEHLAQVVPAPRAKAALDKTSGRFYELIGGFYLADADMKNACIYFSLSLYSYAAVHNFKGLTNIAEQLAAIMPQIIFEDGRSLSKFEGLLEIVSNQTAVLRGEVKTYETKAERIPPKSRRSHLYIGQAEILEKLSQLTGYYISLNSSAAVLFRWLADKYRDREMVSKAQKALEKSADHYYLAATVYSHLEERNAVKSLDLWESYADVLETFLSISSVVSDDTKRRASEAYRNLSHTFELWAKAFEVNGEKPKAREYYGKAAVYKGKEVSRYVLPGEEEEVIDGAIAAARYYVLAGEYKKAENTMKIAEAFIDSFDQEIITAENQGDLARAIEFCVKRAHIFEEKSSPVFLALYTRGELKEFKRKAAKLYGMSSSFSDKRGMLSDAVTYVEKSLVLSEEMEDQREIIRSLIAAAMLHRRNGDYRITAEYNVKAAEISEFRGEYPQAAAAYDFAAEAMEIVDPYSSDVIGYAEKGLELWRKTEDIDKIARALTKLAIIHAEMKHYSEAAYYNEQNIPYLIQLKEWDEFLNAVIFAMTLYVKSGKPENALRIRGISLELLKSRLKDDSGDTYFRYMRAVEEKWSELQSKRSDGGDEKNSVPGDDDTYAFFAGYLAAVAGIEYINGIGSPFEYVIFAAAVVLAVATIIFRYRMKFAVLLGSVFTRGIIAGSIIGGVLSFILGFAGVEHMSGPLTLSVFFLYIAAQRVFSAMGVEFDIKLGGSPGKPQSFVLSLILRKLGYDEENTEEIISLYNSILNNGTFYFLQDDIRRADLRKNPEVLSRFLQDFIMALSAINARDADFHRLLELLINGLAEDDIFADVREYDGFMDGEREEIIQQLYNVSIASFSYFALLSAGLRKIKFAYSDNSMFVIVPCGKNDIFFDVIHRVVLTVQPKGLYNKNGAYLVFAPGKDVQQGISGRSRLSPADVLSAYFASIQTGGMSIFGSALLTVSASVMEEIKDFDKAGALVDRALKFNKKNAAAYNVKGLLAERQGDFSLARAMYETVGRLRPDDKEVQILLWHLEQAEKMKEYRNELSQERIEIVRNVMKEWKDENIRGVVIFGSTAKGTADELSDIDYQLIKRWGENTLVFDEGDMTFAQAISGVFNGNVSISPVMPFVFNSPLGDSGARLAIQMFYMSPEASGIQAYNWKNHSRPLIDAWIVVARTPEEEQELAARIRTLVREEIVQVKNSRLHTGSFENDGGMTKYDEKDVFRIIDRIMSEYRKIEERQLYGLIGLYSTRSGIMETRIVPDLIEAYETRKGMDLPVGIGIAGCAGSGKTSVARELKALLADTSTPSSIIVFDHWMLDPGDRPLNTVTGAASEQIFDKFEVRKFVESMRLFIQGQSMLKPVYDTTYRGRIKIGMDAEGILTLYCGTHSPVVIIEKEPRPYFEITGSGDAKEEIVLDERVVSVCRLPGDPFSIAVSIGETVHRVEALKNGSRVITVLDRESHPVKNSVNQFTGEIIAESRASLVPGGYRDSHGNFLKGAWDMKEYISAHAGGVFIVEGLMALYDYSEKSEKEKLAFLFDRAIFISVDFSVRLLRQVRRFSSRTEVATGKKAYKLDIIGMMNKIGSRVLIEDTIVEPTAGN